MAWSTLYTTEKKYRQDQDMIDEIYSALLERRNAVNYLTQLNSPIPYRDIHTYVVYAKSWIYNQLLYTPRFYLVPVKASYSFNSWFNTLSSTTIPDWIAYTSTYHTLIDRYNIFEIAKIPSNFFTYTPYRMLNGNGKYFIGDSPQVVRGFKNEYTIPSGTQYYPTGQTEWTTLDYGMQGIYRLLNCLTLMKTMYRVPVTPYTTNASKIGLWANDNVSNDIALSQAQAMINYSSYAFDSYTGNLFCGLTYNEWFQSYGNDYWRSSIQSKSGIYRASTPTQTSATKRDYYLVLKSDIVAPQIFGENGVIVNPTTYEERVYDDYGMTNVYSTDTLLSNEDTFATTWDTNIGNVFASSPTPTWAGQPTSLNKKCRGWIESRADGWTWFEFDKSLR
jgi:hypothetical protein